MNNFLKFISLVAYIKLFFNFLPIGLQSDLVDTLEDYKCMIRISKLERSKKNAV